MLRKKITITLIVLGILALAVWFGYRYFMILMIAKYRAEYKMPPTVVQIHKATKQPWQPTIEAIGSLSADEGVTLTTEVAGRITQIYFKSGTYVKANTPLVQLYPKIIQAELNGAKAQLAVDKVNLGRFTKLFKKGFYDKASLDKAKATVEGDQAKVDNYQAQLDQLTIKAPFSGRLGLRQVSLGDFLNTGDPIADLQAVDPIRVDFNVPEIYLGQIKPGYKITITSRAVKDKIYEGTIYAFNSKVDPNSRMIGVRAHVPNKNFALVPGAFVEVTAYIDKAQQPIIIPQTAVLYSLEGSYVYLMKNHKAIKTPITVGEKLDDNRIIVVKGLHAGDPIIVGGQEKLHDNDTVITQDEYEKQQKKTEKAKK